MLIEKWNEMDGFFYISIGFLRSRKTKPQQKFPDKNSNLFFVSLPGHIFLLEGRKKKKKPKYEVKSMHVSSEWAELTQADCSPLFASACTNALALPDWTLLSPWRAFIYFSRFYLRISTKMQFPSWLTFPVSLPLGNSPANPCQEAQELKDCL